MPKVVAAPELEPSAEVKVGVTSVEVPATAPNDVVNGPLTVTVGAAAKPTPSLVRVWFTPAPSSFRTMVLPIETPVLGRLICVDPAAPAVAPGVTVVAALAGSRR